MIFTQHYLACLSHASYLIGDETTGRAVVVDPRRDVGVYLEEAAASGSDHRAGHRDARSRRLPQRPPRARGARRAPSSPTATAPMSSSRSSALHDGQRLSLGDVTLEILATPGHTPESICIVVYEHADDAMPYGVLTGDTLFVGDVGRPDLLAVGADADLSADTLARQPLPLAARQAAAASRRDPRLPGARRRLVVRQAAVDRDQLDPRRAAAHELRAPDR